MDIKAGIQLFMVLCVLCISQGLDAATNSNWGYTAGTILPASWSTVNKQCQGWRQSPINIDHKDVRYNKDLRPPEFVLTTAGKLPNNYTCKLYSDDHKVLVVLPDPRPQNIFYNNKLALCPHHIHWHWGASSSRGSEHTFDGQAYAMEGHLVTWNCAIYSDFSTAAGSPNGLAVFGVVYRVVTDASLEDKNVFINAVTAKLSEPAVQQAMGYHNGTKVDFPGFDLTEFLPTNTKDFYRYEGSLTTPPCTENVLWTVFKTFVNITEAHITEFRKLLYPGAGQAKLVDNYRPVVLLNNGDPMSALRYISSSFIISSAHKMWLSSTFIWTGVITVLITLKSLISA